MAEVKLYRPAQLDPIEWVQLQSIERSAYLASLNLSLTAINALVSWGEPEVFEASHVNPRGAVGKQLNYNQDYRYPRVAVAVENGELIGWSYAAHNVSHGNPDGPQDNSLKAQAIRLAKFGTIIMPPSINKDYFALRDVVVRPDQPDQQFRKRGIAKQMVGALLLHAALPQQPVTYYDWPEIEPEWLRPALLGYGFTLSGGGRWVHIPGENNSPIWQERLQANSAWSLRKNMRHNRIPRKET